MPNLIPYKSFCWSLGTTSFRTKNFNKTIEEQLALLDEFWSLEENKNETWSGNKDLQTRYYDFMQSKGFVEGNAGNKPKDAREKTSGLVDIGLIDDGRKLSNAGKALLKISFENDFSSDNQFQIAKDSFIYLKQLLKTYYNVDGHTVRPFMVLIHLLDKFDYLTLDEYTYLLPLCIGEKETAEIVEGISKLRSGSTSIDQIIIDRLMAMPNYKTALDYLLENEVTQDLICEIGLNRKSRQYDKPYYELYNALFKTFVNNSNESISAVYLATKDINIGKWWRSYLFNTSSEAAIKKDPWAHLKQTVFNKVSDEVSFKKIFFNIMHLFKAKATLSDYLDLNRRYIKTTDVVLFEDDTIKLDIVPKHFFKTVAENLYLYTFTSSELLYENCDMSEISACLVVSDETVVAGINEELGINVSDMQSAREADIVYEYEETEYYPEHTLLLEATLADSTNQRRMEMEPVSRHLGMHLIRTGNMNSYCVFATNYLNINVISDFRSRKTTPFYDPQDYSKSVAGMKIIPLQTSELKKIVSNGKTYKELYPIFETAFNSALPPHEWYENCIKI